MRKFKKIAAVVLGGAILGSLLTGCTGSDKIVIGSKDFSENIVLSEIMAQLIENDTDIKVERKLNMGGTFVNFEAIKNGGIDLYPEYTGTGLTAQLEMDVINDADQVYDIVKREFDSQFGVKWLEPLGFNNTYAMGVTAEAAEKYNLEKTSDLTAVAGDLVFGGEHEFFDRQDGYDGLIAAYGIEAFKNLAKMNVSLKYQAIGQGQMDVTDVFTTDGQIIEFNLKILEDDLGFFPPYYAAPIVKNETLEKHPELEGVLNKLAGQISDEDMTNLNYQVDVEKKSIEEVAKGFLESKGLLK